MCDVYIRDALAVLLWFTPALWSWKFTRKIGWGSLIKLRYIYVKSEAVVLVGKMVENATNFDFIIVLILALNILNIQRMLGLKAY